MGRKPRSALPGFHLSMAIMLLYLGLIVLLPMAALTLKAATLTWGQFWSTVTAPRVLASYRLSLLTAATAALINALFGLLVAWVLVRYRFTGRRIIDGLVDLPFALPTAVGGLALTALYAGNGWFGRILERISIKAVFTPLGIVIALTFIGLPFVVRTVQPVLQAVGEDLEEAAATLGASRWAIFSRVTLPSLLPAVLTGFSLAFARGLGEYGSVIFISGNMPMRTEIAPLLVMGKLEQYDYAGAGAIALVMLAISFVLLLAINAIQWHSHRRHGSP